MTVVSPHFDDAPLSLGQSLRDGALASCDVDVRVAFGRTNWTSWVHPTPGRAPLVGTWRRMEETAASVLFGYRWRAAGWDEVILRHAEDGEGALAPEAILDPQRDLSDEPLVHEVAEWLELVTRAATPDLLLVCAGFGGHVDHRIVATAAAGLVGSLGVPLGFYEDRPYISHLDAAQRDAQLASLGVELEPVDVSGPVTRSTQMRARRCYPSQMAPYFEDAMDLDRAVDACERVWFPVGSAPEWL